MSVYWGCNLRTKADAERIRRQRIIGRTLRACTHLRDWRTDARPPRVRSRAVRVSAVPRRKLWTLTQEYLRAWYCSGAEEGAFLAKIRRHYRQKGDKQR